MKLEREAFIFSRSCISTPKKWDVDNEKKELKHNQQLIRLIICITLPRICSKVSTNSGQYLQTITANIRGHPLQIFLQVRTQSDHQINKPAVTVVGLLLYKNCLS